MVVHDDNVGVAFALTVVAGLSTAVGAAVVFTPSLIKYATRSVLAAALAFAAGVMTYVSFAEIFGESVECFKDAGSDEDKAVIFATLSFFGGVFMMVVSTCRCLHHTKCLLTFQNYSLIRFRTLLSFNIFLF